MGPNTTSTLPSECTCPLAGFCERHNVNKHPHWWELCQSRLDYRDKWDEGNGPGQKRRTRNKVEPRYDVEAFRQHWKKLHTKQNPTPEWFADWLARIPNGGGCNCKRDFRLLLDANPPRYEDWFAWSVEIHNAVNRKLGKREWTLDKALEVWIEN